MPDRADQSPGKENDPVIGGIGASAGGVQALQTLFDGLPDGTGASFAVIVHLDRQAHSNLASILAAHAHAGGAGADQGAIEAKSCLRHSARSPAAASAAIVEGETT